jgi:hypothetical protein
VDLIVYKRVLVVEIIVELLKDFFIKIKVLKDGLLSDYKIKIYIYFSVPFYIKLFSINFN